MRYLEDKIEIFFDEELLSSFFFGINRTLMSAFFWIISVPRSPAIILIRFFLDIFLLLNHAVLLSVV